MMRHRIFFLALLLFFGTVIRLEGQRFGAGIVAGINASQIQGDDSAGFNRLGVRAGLRGLVFLSEKSGFSLDLLYSARGSTNELGFQNNYLRWVIHLDYVEVPVRFYYRDWLAPAGFYRVQGSAGLSYGRLFNTRVVDNILANEQESFSQNDLSVNLGIAYRAGRKFSFEVQYTRSVIPLYNNKKHLNIAGEPRYKYSLWGYLLSFQGVYEF